MKRKLFVLAVILAFLATASSWSIQSPAQAREDAPTPQQIAYARNLYHLTGYCGEAKVYIDRWPAYADQIIGGYSDE